MTLANSWAEILGKLLRKDPLNRQEAIWAMTQIMAGDASDAQVGAFMLALRSKGETVEELAGLVDVMLSNAVILDTGNDAVDIVGTGGDMVGTVNVSSMAAILTAAAGVPVMKHGSRSASGKTGSSEMLEVLGIRLDLSPERVADVFREVGITFSSHRFSIQPCVSLPQSDESWAYPQLSTSGPLANPAQPIATSLGVANASVAPLMASEMASRGRSALVFRGLDGLDELTTTGASEIWEVAGGEVRQSKLNPHDLGLKQANLTDLIGGDAQHNAHVAKSLFEGNFEGPVADIVRLNAAAGIVAYELAKDPGLIETSLSDRFEAALERATIALVDGRGASALSRWMTATQA